MQKQPMIYSVKLFSQVKDKSKTQPVWRFIEDISVDRLYRIPSQFIARWSINNEQSPNNPFIPY